MRQRRATMTPKHWKLLRTAQLALLLLSACAASCAILGGREPLPLESADAGTDTEPLSSDVDVLDTNTTGDASAAEDTGEDASRPIDMLMAEDMPPDRRLRRRHRLRRDRVGPRPDRLLAAG